MTLTITPTYEQTAALFLPRMRPGRTSSLPGDRQYQTLPHFMDEYPHGDGTLAAG
jgi:hypothetical protein